MTIRKKGDLVAQAYETLRKKIITLQIRPGEYLVEKALMAELKIGRTPLRQAILLLKNDNFVEGQPHRSPYVKELNLDEVKELFETLMILEKNITYLAALRIVEADLGSLEEVQGNLERAIGKKDFWHIARYNLEFHQLIAKAGRNRFLEKMHHNTRLQAERLSYIAVSRELDDAASRDDHNRRICEQHNNLIACLRKKDQKKIEALSVAHVRLFQGRILKSLMEISFL
jgi:DNA-binding GntR family transcriptional regulator